MKKHMSICLLILFFSCAPSHVLIQDLRTIPQKSMFRVQNRDRDNLLITETFQAELNAQYDSLYFAPWHMNPDCITSDLNRNIFKYYKQNPGWGENRMPRDSMWIKAHEHNANLDMFPNLGQAGMTTNNTNLRAIPTNKPVFRDFKLAGEGYPFDYLQVSSIPVNTPVYILHQSKDKAWYYAASHIARGWIPANHIAFADSNLIQLWEACDQVVLVQDEESIYHHSGKFLYRAPLGSCFPLVRENTFDYHVFSATSDNYGQIRLLQCTLSKSAAMKKPVPLTYKHLQLITEGFIGEPYGWGGLFQNRDCSALIKDLFGPFGIMLPRHSTHQAKSRKEFFDLSYLKTKDKEKFIIENGIPYLTLLWLKGHIMLYIGEQQGKALAFHNIWGIRTKSFFGKEGRKIVGQAVITTLSPGKELNNRDKNADLLKRIRGMAYIVPRDSINFIKSQIQ